jgi:hypothetical protein
MAVGFAIGVCFALRLRIVEGLAMFLTFAMPIALMALHGTMFDDALSYMRFNKDRQGLVGWSPFPEVVRGASATDNAFNLDSFLDLYTLYVIGAMVVCVRAAPVGVFACVHLAYVAMLRHMDLFRYTLPAAVFVVLIGLDALWAHH